MMKVTWLIQAMIYLFLFSFLWWSFTDGSKEQLWIGGLAVTVSTVIAMQTRATARIFTWDRIRALVLLIPYFIYESIRGGLLVAKLVLLPQRLIQSHFVEYETELPESAVLARMWFAATICIFPGTLSCGYKDNILTIHVLNVGLLEEKAIQRLEKLIGSIFGTRRN